MNLLAPTWRVPPALLFVMLFVLLPASEAMSGLNCWGPGPALNASFHKSKFPDNPPLFMRGNPYNTNMWASLSMPVNFTVAFIGDQGSLDYAAIPVLKMIKDEKSDMILHSGDFDYINSPSVWNKMVDDILGPSFPYFALIGNHDCTAWSGQKGYQQYIYDRLVRIGADISCIGEVGINLVCSYKGITFVMSSYGTTLSSCNDYCSSCPYAGGHAAFIERALQSFPSMWRVCAWHKNHRLMQVGTKPIEVGLPMYDLCRKYGAIVATAHEHSYCRTHLMDSFEELKVASTNNTLNIGDGRTFAFVSGIAGWKLRPFDGDLYKNPWWASTWSASNNATYGALICKFNLNGKLNQSFCYTKFVDGRIADSFFLETNQTEPDQKPMCTQSFTTENQIDIAGNDIQQDTSSGAITCATDDLEIEISSSKLVALRFVNVAVNSSSSISEAYLEFTASREGTDLSDATIWAEHSPNAAYIACDKAWAISSRNKTSASVQWDNIEAFGLGGIYRSPNVAPLINEVISLPGWKSGNSITFFIQGGSGKRVAKSYEGDHCGAPSVLINTGVLGSQTCQSFEKPSDSPNGAIVALIVIVLLVAVAGIGGFLYYFHQGRYQRL